MRPENIVPFVCCPECIKHNFHAVFHSTYFQICLIHGCVLTSICQSCKSNEYTIKSGLINCSKCNYTLFDEDKFLPDEEFRKLILQEVIPFKEYINRYLKKGDCTMGITSVYTTSSIVVS